MKKDRERKERHRKTEDEGGGREGGVSRRREEVEEEGRKGRGQGNTSVTRVAGESGYTFSPYTVFPSPPIPLKTTTWAFRVTREGTHVPNPSLKNLNKGCDVILKCS